MARGSDGKAARKKSRKEARAAEAERILNGEDDLNTFSLQRPPFVTFEAPPDRRA